MKRAGCAILLGALSYAASAAAQDVTWDTVKSLLADDEDERKRALEALEKSPDPTLMAGLNDILYYHYVAGQSEGARAISRVMEAITGERVADRRNPRETWAEWVGRHDEVEPKDGYLLFKRWLFEHYDRAFRGFFSPRFSYRIRIEEIEWGGVQKDGIPALDEPGFVAADDADYLEGDERVFGIELNGEAKAYPHRIMDAHEMCNDIVGGVHVSLSYCTLCGSGVLYAGAHRVSRRQEAFHLRLLRPSLSIQQAHVRPADEQLVEQPDG